MIDALAAADPSPRPSESPSPSSSCDAVIQCPELLYPTNWDWSSPELQRWSALTVLVLLVILLTALRYRPAPQGMAGAVSLWVRCSLTSMRWSSRQTRPSLGLARWWAPPSEVGIYLGRSVSPRRRLLSSFEDSILVVGLAGQGKDTWAGNVAAEAPGAMVAATTKAEDIEPWIRIRARDGRPVAVFNPDGLGGVPSSLRYSPVAGCRDPEVAIETAGYLLMGSADDQFKGMRHGDFFSNKAAMVLRCLLIAAACSGGTLRTVYEWTTDESNREPLNILERANAELTDRPYSGFLGDLRQVFNSKAKVTSGSVYQTLSSLLQFMASPAVAATVDVHPDHGGFDVESFLRARGTLVLLGAAKEAGTTAPLLTCLVGRLVDRAQIIASHMPKGRLDPPLTLFLNEASKIIPLPVDKYFADHRGKNIPTIVMVQSRHHLRARWGADRGGAIWDTAPVKLLYGGSTDEDYLTAVEKIGGSYTYREPVAAHESSGFGRARAHVERRNVIDADKFRLLPKFRYLIIRSNLKPVEARTRKVWRRRDVRAAIKAHPEFPPTCATFTPEMADRVEAAMRARTEARWSRQLARSFTRPAVTVPAPRRGDAPITAGRLAGADEADAVPGAAPAGPVVWEKDR